MSSILAWKIPIVTPKQTTGCCRFMQHRGNNQHRRVKARSGLIWLTGFTPLKVPPRVRGWELHCCCALHCGVVFLCAAGSGGALSPHAAVKEEGAQPQLAVKVKVQVKVVGRHCAFYTHGVADNTCSTVNTTCLLQLATVRLFSQVVWLYLCTYSLQYGPKCTVKGKCRIGFANKNIAIKVRKIKTLMHHTFKENCLSQTGEKKTKHVSSSCFPRHHH